jgi:hypothetical protein
LVRLRNPGLWPLSWWQIANVLWCAAIVSAVFGIYSIWHGWPWEWVVGTFVVLLASNAFRMWRTARKRSAR